MKDEREYDVGDIHGQFIFNYRHPHLTDEQAAEFMVRAFDARLAATARAPCGSCGRPWPAGSGTRTIPTRASAAAFAGKHASWATRSRRWSPPRRGTTATSPPMHAKMSALLQNCIANSAGKPGSSPRSAAAGCSDDPPRGKKPGRGLDLRAAHVLRAKRRRHG